jgi:hypothetical protein
MIAASKSLPATSTCKLECRLRLVGNQKTNHLVVGGELELKNISDGPIEIASEVHPLQHLDIQVKDRSGRLISTSWYGNQFSPSEYPSQLRLEPGESFVAQVSLFATVPAALRVPGTYAIQALYDHPGVRTESNPLTVTI